MLKPQAARQRRSAEHSLYVAVITHIKLREERTYILNIPHCCTLKNITLTQTSDAWLIAWLLFCVEVKNEVRLSCCLFGITLLDYFYLHTTVTLSLSLQCAP